MRGERSCCSGREAAYAARREVDGDIPRTPAPDSSLLTTLSLRSPSSHPPLNSLHQGRSMREYPWLARQHATDGYPDPNQTSQTKHGQESSRSKGDTNCAAKDCNDNQHRDAVRSPPPQGTSVGPVRVRLADRVVGNAPNSGVNRNHVGKDRKSRFVCTYWDRWGLSVCSARELSPKPAHPVASSFEGETVTRQAHAVRGDGGN